MLVEAILASVYFFERVKVRGDILARSFELQPVLTRYIKRYHILGSNNSAPFFSELKVLAISSVGMHNHCVVTWARLYAWLVNACCWTLMLSGSTSEKLWIQWQTVKKATEERRSPELVVHSLFKGFYS